MRAAYWVCIVSSVTKSQAPERGSLACPMAATSLNYCGPIRIRAKGNYSSVRSMMSIGARMRLARSNATADCVQRVTKGMSSAFLYIRLTPNGSPARRKEGKSCQSCHMAATGRMTNVAPGHGGLDRDPKTLGNHRFFNINHEEMLAACLKLEAAAHRTESGVSVEVGVRAEGVGHRVPTGFIDKQILLVVEGFAAGKESLSLPAMRGPRLPGEAGDLASEPGKLFARILKDGQGNAPVPFWRAELNPPLDTRLEPGRTDRTAYLFPKETVRIRIRLIHRKFWHAVAEQKGWPDNDTLIKTVIVEL